MILLIRLEDFCFLLKLAPDEQGLIDFLVILKGLIVFLFLIIQFNLQRILYYLNRMGSSHHTKTLLTEFNVEQSFGSLSVISKKIDTREKYLMKTYTANTKQQLVPKITFFKNYKSKMQQNQQLTKLIEILQEKDDYFCSTSHKLHLIYQYSDFNIGNQIKERRQGMLNIHNRQDTINRLKYFNYEDLCNILYSCLSALWFSKQLIEDNPDYDLNKFNATFLSTSNILIFGDGILKIMDPFIMDYHSRYNFSHKIYYSPQKLANFGMTDDEKCSIFELGMNLLEISLLEPISQAYSGHEYMEQITTKKLQKARQIYSSQQENNFTVSVFDLIEKMIERDRQDRFSLQEAIQYAQQMYEDQESLAQEISPSNPAKFYSSNDRKKQLNKTNNTSSAKKSTNINRFYDFKNSTVQNRGEESMLQSLRSPKIRPFTIHQVEADKQQQSSMLQSLMVDNIKKNSEINQSLIEDGIFSTINLGDSYNYGHHLPLRFTTSFKEEKIFTDPQLLRTIHRELIQIDQRKKSRMRCSRILFSGSKIIQRKARFDYYEEINTNLKMTNNAYLQ